MAISINWATRVIYIPKSFMTLIQSSPEIRQLDLNVFRLAVKALEASEIGMAYPDAHIHVTETIASGVTYARFVIITNGYTVEFEDGMYSVSCIGANHNLGDVKVVNSVSLIIGNSAGLQIVTSGSGVTEQDKTDIANLVLEELVSGHTTAGTLGKVVTDIATSASSAATNASTAASNSEQAATKADMAAAQALEAAEQAVSAAEISALAKAAADNAKTAADTAASNAEALQTLTTDLHDARLGGWEIDADLNQLIYKRLDGTILKRFALYNDRGEPSLVNVYKRVPIP